jgi:hypothetical protein
MRCADNKRAASGGCGRSGERPARSHSIEGIMTAFGIPYWLIGIGIVGVSMIILAIISANRNPADVREIDSD